MGHLIDGGSTEYTIDDRMLAHAKAAIAAKLRRQECFLLSWHVDLDRGSGRVSLWMAPSVPLEFRCSGSRVPELDGAWLEALVAMGASARGMVLSSEDEAVAAWRGGAATPRI